MRYHLRAEHPAEAKRWVIALTETKQWLQDNGEFKKSKQKSSEALVQAAAVTSAVAANTTRKSSVTMMSQPSISSESLVDDDDDMKSESSFGTRPAGTGHAHGMINGFEDVDEEICDSGGNYLDALNASVNAALASVQYLDQLAVAAAGKLDMDQRQLQLTETQSKAFQALRQSLHQVLHTAEEREEHWTKRMAREEALKRAWDENLRELAAEHDTLRRKAAQEVSHLESQARLSMYSSMTVNGDGKIANGIPAPDAPLAPGAETDDEFYDALDEYEALHSAVSPLPSVNQLGGRTSDTQVLEAAKGEIAPSSALQVVAASADARVTVEGYPASGAGHRKLLPLARGEKPIRIETSLWSVLKNSIGKDLSKIALPGRSD